MQDVNYQAAAVKMTASAGGVSVGAQKLFLSWPGVGWSSIVCTLPPEFDVFLAEPGVRWLVCAALCLCPDKNAIGDIAECAFKYFFCKLR